MYTVIGDTRSRTLRVLWMLQELDLPHIHEPAAPQSETVRAIDPLGRIPLMRTGDAVLSDSVAIMAFLGDRHADRAGADTTGGLSQPAGSVGRAQLDALVLRIIDEFDALLWTRARHSFILPEKLRVPAVIATLDKELARNAARLDAVLGDQDFLTGARMTIADIMAAHCCGWAITGGVALAPPPRLAAYLKRMRSRPAYLRALGRAPAGPSA